MKVLEFETSKGKFCLLDMPYKIRVNGWNGYIVLSEDLQISQTKFASGYYLKNITEEQTSEIVESVNKKRFVFYKNYIKNQFEDTLTFNAIDSLHSLFKSKVIHLYEKPYLPEELINNQEAFMADLKAEEKTFYNPYIFKL